MPVTRGELLPRPHRSLSRRLRPPLQCGRRKRHRWYLLRPRRNDPPSEPPTPVLGREAIRAFLRDFHSAAERRFIIPVTHIESSGDLAYVIGSYTVTIQAPNGSVLYHKGNLLETW